MGTCERAKRRREECVFETEMERQRLVNQERRQRLKLEALTTVCGLFAGDRDDAEVRALAAALAKGVLTTHVGEAPLALGVPTVEIVSDDEADPDYYPGMPEPEQAQSEDSHGRRACSVMLFFSALANERPPPQDMLASDLYASYKQFCVSLVTSHVTANAMEREDVLIQARSSFGLLVRAIRGAQKRPTAEGTRYTFDWPAIVRHLHSNGGYCKRARL
jgi:hypothetical protein